MINKITKKDVTKLINNEIDHKISDINPDTIALAHALLDAWAALHTITEMAKMRSDVNGFKAVARNHLPEEYTE